MKMQQFVGPFQESTKVLNAENVTYLQIGVEYPYSIPILELDDNNWPIVVSINSQDFVITDKDILELELNHESITVTVYENLNPYVIINIAYENAN